MPSELFTETTCSKCKKVVRTKGTDAFGEPCPSPGGWGELELAVRDSSRMSKAIKQLELLDLCPACVSAMLEFLGVLRKRQRKAKAIVMQVTAPVPPVETQTDTDGLSIEQPEWIERPAMIMEKPTILPSTTTSSGPSTNIPPTVATIATIVTTNEDLYKLGEDVTGLAAPKKRGRPRKQPAEQVVDIPCPHRDSTPHIHVQEGELTLCKYPKDVSSST